MDASLCGDIAAALRRDGRSEAEIERALAYAQEIGFGDPDEAYALAMSRVLYDDEQLRGGARFKLDGLWREGPTI